jgi:antitoxin VapB
MYILDVYTEPVMTTTKVFKSGNSVAVRLPKSLGVKAGTEMRVREERGRYVLEPIENEEKIDLTGIYGSCPELKPLRREDRMFKPRKLDWDGKLLKRD